MCALLDRTYAKCVSQDIKQSHSWSTGFCNSMYLWKLSHWICNLRFAKQPKWQVSPRRSHWQQAVTVVKTLKVSCSGTLIHCKYNFKISTVYQTCTWKYQSILQVHVFLVPSLHTLTHWRKRVFFIIHLKWHHQIDTVILPQLLN